MRRFLLPAAAWRRIRGLQQWSIAGGPYAYFVRYNFRRSNGVWVFSRDDQGEGFHHSDGGDEYGQLYHYDRCRRRSFRVADLDGEPFVRRDWIRCLSQQCERHGLFED